jgi:hypothetical protein
MLMQLSRVDFLRLSPVTLPRENLLLKTWFGQAERWGVAGAWQDTREQKKIARCDPVRGACASQPFFYYVQGLGEGRENRPQLRCGNASQTSIAR